MENFKKIIKYVVISLTSLLIFLLILTYPLIFSLYSTVIDQKNVIKILRDSDSYSTLPAYIFENGFKHKGDEGRKNDTNIDSTVVKKLLGQKAIQNHIQDVTEEAINQTYTQMKEKKSKINIQMDVLKLKTIALTVLLQIDSKNGGKEYSITELVKCTVISRINKNAPCTQDIVKMNKNFDNQLKQFDSNYKPGDKTVTIVNIDQPLIPLVYNNLLILPAVLLLITFLIIVINVLLFKDRIHGLLETGFDILIAGVTNLILWLIVHNNVEAILKSMNFDKEFIPLATAALKVILEKHIFFTNLTLVIASVIIATSLTIQVIKKQKDVKQSA